MAKKKYDELSQQIIEMVGGRDNVQLCLHCMTRLRFHLKDLSIVRLEEINKVGGVVGSQITGDQLQIIIGTHVKSVYDVVCSQLGVAAQEGIAENLDGEARGGKKKNILGMLVSNIIGIIGPLIPVLVGTGLGKCILMIVSMLGLANADSSMTYYVFNFVFDAGFTFLPVFVALAAARHFKCNMYIAAVLGCALIHPNWNTMVSALDPKFIGEMFGIFPLYGMPYTSTLIPAMLAVWVMAKWEHWLEKVLPELIKGVAKPLIVLLVMTPLTFLLLAPAAGIVSIYLGQALLWIYNTFGMIGMAVLCIVYPWLVVTGMHSTLAIAGIQILSQTGYDPLSRVLTLTANMAQGSAAFACAVKTKNKKFRSTCVSAGFTAFVGGITEPCIYGVTLRLKKPMYAVMIGCGAAGLYAGLIGLKAYAFMSPSLVNFPMWIGGEGSANLIHAFITMAIAIAVTFVATLLIGFEDPEEGAQKAAEA